MKYILVTGGVISGVGKGIIASSFGTILKARGLQITSIKIDPYINIDAGTFSPYEHGEVYVLDDGAEVDLDLGNYERFLDVTLHKHNNITTGKIYQSVIEKERRGEYLGKTVQVVPHITDAIQEWIERISIVPVTDDGSIPDICIIELGGTIGDIEGMPFVEAFRQFQFKVKKENFCLVHVSLIPQPKSTGEQKTKPTQASVRELRSLGLSPDIIVCRSETPINRSIQEKISNFCHVEPEQVISIHDLSSIYKVPILLESQGVIKLFNAKLHLNILQSNNIPDFMSKWKNMAIRAESISEEKIIVIVGKYTKLEDSYVSVSRALQHAALSSVDFKLKLTFIEATDLEEITEKENPSVYYDAWAKLSRANGVVVPGGFGERGFDGKVAACKYCREQKIPFLGICMGLQAAVVEFSRNVLNLKANSTEIVKDTENCVIIDMPEYNTGIMGGTMRLGKRSSHFVSEHKSASAIYHLYDCKDVIEERHRHRYEVNKEFAESIDKAGLHFVATDENNERMEIAELIDHPYFVCTQFHPEYLSRPLKPSPPFVGLVRAACGKLEDYLKNKYAFRS